MSAPPPVKQIRFSTPPNAKEAATEKSASAVQLNDASHHRRSTDFTSKSAQTTGFDGQPALVRLPSSKSLTSLGARGRSSSQRQHRTRNQHMRSLGMAANAEMSFHQLPTHANDRIPPLPIFHTDSIVDPDLAPFMSDEDSSDEEVPNIGDVLASDVQEQPVSGFQQNFFGALRRSRPQSIARSRGETHQPHLDADSASMDSSYIGRKRRYNASRTVSVASLGHHR